MQPSSRTHHRLAAIVQVLMNRDRSALHCKLQSIGGRASRLPARPTKSHSRSCQSMHTHTRANTPAHTQPPLHLLPNSRPPPTPTAAWGRAGRQVAGATPSSTHAMRGPPMPRPRPHQPAGGSGGAQLRTPTQLLGLLGLALALQRWRTAVHPYPAAGAGAAARAATAAGAAGAAVAAATGAAAAGAAAAAAAAAVGPAGRHVRRPSCPRRRQS